MKSPALKSLVSIVMIAMLVAACSQPAGPGATTPAATPTLPQPTATVPDYPAPTPAESQPTETQPGYPAPTLDGSPPPATQPGYPAPGDEEATQPATVPGKVISKENAADLEPVTVQLPEYPERILWPEPGLLPPAPEANLLLQSGTNLHPVTIQPGNGASLSDPIQLPLEGSTIIAAAPDASTLLALTMESGLLALYAPTGEQQHIIEHPAPYGANFSQDGRFLVVASQMELAADVYDAASGENLAHLTGFETAAPVYNAFIAAGGETVVYISRATVQFQDVASGQFNPSIHFEDFVSAHAFSWDGSRLAVAAGTRLEVYSVPGGERIAETTLSQPANSLAFSPDGTLLAGGYGAGIQLWDPETLAPVATLPGPNAFTGQVAFSPDGLQMVSVHEDNILSIWRVP